MTTKLQRKKSKRRAASKKKKKNFSSHSSHHSDSSSSENLQDLVDKLELTLEDMIECDIANGLLSTDSPATTSTPKSATMLPDRAGFFLLDELPIDILEAVQFWAVHTPSAVALKVPSPVKPNTMISISWRFLDRALVVYAMVILSQLDMSEKEEARPTVCILTASTHDAILPWLALSSLGFPVQFISPMHEAEVAAELLQRAKTEIILEQGMPDAWLKQVVNKAIKSSQAENQEESPTANQKVTKLKIARLEKDLLAQLAHRLDDGLEACHTAPRITELRQAFHTRKPKPFVYLHSFGSTARPKLYAIPLESANHSAKSAADWAHRIPPASRWQCQLQTSLPFHFSFQNPMWRGLKCGTTTAFPFMDTKVTSPADPLKLVPTPTNILDSLAASGSDIVYASPNALQRICQLSKINPAHGTAMRKLKQAHTGGAPVSDEQAAIYRRFNLLVFQIFASTEAGLLFIGRHDVTGDVTHLMPMPDRVPYLVFNPIPESDCYQLWLLEDCPGVCNELVEFENCPGMPGKKAWRTGDTFRILKDTRAQAPQDILFLVKFVGREDDWLRCTNGTAVRALEIENYALRRLSRSGSLATVNSIALIGHGRPFLSLIIELKNDSTVAELNYFAGEIMTVILEINDRFLQHPAILRPQLVHITNPTDDPIRVSDKGNLIRYQNEEHFGNLMVDRLHRIAKVIKIDDWQTMTEENWEQCEFGWDEFGDDMHMAMFDEPPLEPQQQRHQSPSPATPLPATPLDATHITSTIPTKGSSESSSKKSDAAGGKTDRWAALRAERSFPC